MAAAKPPASYNTLTTLLREINTLNNVLLCLKWDEWVMMPPGSAAQRAKQTATLAAVIHEKTTGAAFATAIAAAERDLGRMTDAYAVANVRDARRLYEQEARVPRELVMQKQIAASECYEAWVSARKNNDWVAFVPVVREGLRVFKEFIAATRPGMDVYDAAIDSFERGMTTQRVQQLFDKLRPPLKALLDSVVARGTAPVHPSLRGGPGWEVEAQTRLVKRIAGMLTFDFNRGRIDVSQHPFFAVASSDDIRFTTRYSLEKPLRSVMSAIHETGHAIYEFGRNSGQQGLPVSKALSFGAHESQSLFWERMVGQRRSFWELVLPAVREEIPMTKDVTADDITAAVNRVDPGCLIRVESNELAYPFHIMIRFEIERGLFDGSIDVDDIPRMWNEGMKKYLDIDVPDDAQGCLQDIHWSTLWFGYFPSYTLGAMAAAQLYAHMDSVGLPGMDERIGRGEFHEIKEYLNDNFHSLGSLHTSLDELLVSVTGEPLKVSYFIDYLTKKYA